jgi:hypothetical protein
MADNRVRIKNTELIPTKHAGKVGEVFVEKFRGNEQFHLAKVEGEVLVLHNSQFNWFDGREVDEQALIDLLA